MLVMQALVVFEINTLMKGSLGQEHSSLMFFS